MNPKRPFNFLIPLLLVLGLFFACATVYRAGHKNDLASKSAAQEEEILEEEVEESLDDLVLSGFALALSQQSLFKLRPSESLLGDQFLSSVSTSVQVGWRMPLRI